MLSDQDRRDRYNRYGAVDGTSPLGGPDITTATEFFETIFGDLFGLGRRKSTTGRDLRYTLELDFEEAALGCEKVLVFERPEDCEACVGTGAEGGQAGLVTCTRCNGEGVIRRKAGFLTSRRECLGCGGTGQVPRVPCKVCEGAGLMDRERRYRVRIAPGSTGGSTQRVPREGAPGRRGGPAGDLHVIVRVRPHAVYSREGDVLIIDVPVTFVEAALGAEVDVPVLDGLVHMKIPPHTQGGSVFRLRGKGFPRSAGAARGDAHVRISIETPTQLGDEARGLLDRLSGLLIEDALPRRRAFREAARKLDKARAGERDDQPNDRRDDQKVGS